MANLGRKTRAVEIIPRQRRPEGQRFGRSEFGVPAGDLTDLGCPDCRGVLAVREEGSKGHLAFSCRVGHAFSGESLVKVKEDQLENALWGAVEVYEEIALLHGELAARARMNRARSVSLAYERRTKQAHAHMKALRALIAKDAPATPEHKKG